MGYLNSEFGLHAVSTQPFLHPEYIYHTWANFNPQYENSYARTEAEYGVGKRFEENYFAGTDANGNKLPANFNWTPTFSFKAGWDDYSSAFEFGEAPENLLAIENVATAANKPGWLMQSDVLSPLAPVSNARSDTFTIRVMGEPKAVRSKKINSRAWLEITVQRIPDYIKPELDAPHHRPDVHVREGQEHTSIIYLRVMSLTMDEPQSRNPPGSELKVCTRHAGMHGGCSEL